MASFLIPEVHDNEDGWGPAPDCLPEQLRFLPFAPFSKNDKLGRACEWTQTREKDRRWLKNRQMEPEQSPFVIEQVDEEGFHLVDTKTAVKPKWGPGAGRRGGMMGGRGGGRGGFIGGWQASRDGQTNVGKQFGRDQKDPRSRFGNQRGRGNRGFDSWRDKPQRIRVASVEIRSDWTALDGTKEEDDFTMSLLSMEKLSLKDEPVGEEVAAVGTICLTDKAVDRASVRAPINLKKLNEPKPWHMATTDDPIIKRLASQGKANIFATDIALAVLMSAPRSVIPWDMVIQRVGDILYLDVRDGCSLYDTTVNETAHEAPDDEMREASTINNLTALNTEASYVNYCFLQQCLDRSTQATCPAPAGSGELSDAWAQRFRGDGPPQAPPPMGKMYRYRRWQLDDDMAIIVRCEVDAAIRTKEDSIGLVTVKAMNEFDSKVSGIEWRQKLESQRAAVLANELKNNRNKLARWTCQALLAGVDYMKIGYVSRFNMKENSSHVILGTQLYRPEEFARQIELKTDNAWGIVTTVMKRLRELKPAADGGMAKYLVLRDPNKPLVNLFRVPVDAFEWEVEEDDDANANRQDDDDSDD